MQGKSNITGFLICENVLKIKKKQLTRRMKGAIIAKSLVRQSISTKKLKKV